MYYLDMMCYHIYTYIHTFLYAFFYIMIEILSSFCVLLKLSPNNIWYTEKEQWYIAKSLHISHTKKGIMFLDTSFTWYDNKVDKSNNVNPSLPLKEKSMKKHIFVRDLKEFMWEIIKSLNSNVICNAFNAPIDHSVMR